MKESQQPPPHELTPPKFWQEEEKETAIEAQVALNQVTGHQHVTMPVPITGGYVNKQLTNIPPEEFTTWEEDLK